MASTTIRPITAGQAARTEQDFAGLAARNPRFQHYLDHHLPFYRKLLDLPA